MEMYTVIVERLEKSGKEIQIEQEIEIESLIGSILGIIHWWITNNRPTPSRKYMENPRYLVILMNI